MTRLPTVGDPMKSRCAALVVSLWLVWLSTVRAQQRTRRVLLLFVVFLIGLGSAQAQERVALVIGNQRYAHAPQLEGAGRDAQAMAKALRDLGFSVDERPDLDLAGMRRALREFEGKANGAAVALIYYAGHGLQLTRGTTGDNYLLPIDAKLKDAREVEDETIALSRMLERLEGAASRIVILDACRDNPLAAPMRNTGSGRNLGRGLAPLAGSDRGTLVVFSTSPGHIAVDDTGMGNGPFATSLLRHITTPGLEVRQMLTRVRAETSRLTNGRQVPWSNDGLFEEVYLAAGSTPEVVELAFWQSIQISGKRADFEAYLTQYPQGRFAALAKNRLADIAGGGPLTAAKPIATPSMSQASQQQQTPRPAAPADECDRLAQPSRTSMGRVPSFAEGVEFARMDGIAALAACEQAARRYPDEVRFVFLRGRALERLGRYPEALRLYSLAADRGYAPAQSNLGGLYETGSGVVQNYSEAVRLYRLAANQGLALAQANLGLMYEDGHGVAKNVAEAVRLYRLAADQGDASAQTNLGVMYEKGHGVAKNVAEAVRLYRLAADQGDASAQTNLGVMYEKGRGVAQNDVEAARLYRLAAEQGNAIAQASLGLMYVTGLGVAKNAAEAVRLYRLAADQGSEMAQHNLGVMYLNGHGVTKNDAEAARFYRLAADQGNAAAQATLGFMYANGRGMKQNDTEAVRFYRLAADQGNASAQTNLGFMYARGRSLAHNDVEAVRLYRLAADQGFAQAQNNLGFMYENGRGVAKNDAEAIRLYRLAARQEHSDAQGALRRLKQTW